MKLTIALFTAMLLLTAQVQAAPIPLVKNKKVTGKELTAILNGLRSPTSPLPAGLRITSAPEQQPAPSPTPVRQGTFKAEIFKFEIKKAADGTYDFTSSQVCLVNGVANVYDLRGVPSAAWSNGPGQSCATTVGGQPATVEIGGDILLLRQTIFTDEPAVDQRGTSNFLGVQVGGNYISYRFSWNRTRDIGSRSQLTYIAPDNTVVCSERTDGSGDVDCVPQLGEFYFSTAEFVD